MMAIAFTSINELPSTVSPFDGRIDHFSSTQAMDAQNADDSTQLDSPPHSKPDDVSFTPKRVVAPPRAWERRPATPYVARNEGQKIWKRIPLGDLGVEGNKSTSIRRSEKDKVDYVRVVKRQKIGHKQVTQPTNSNDAQKEGGSDKENSSDKATNSGSGHYVFSFVSTKSEEDHIEAGGSPKKKLRKAPIEPAGSDGDEELSEVTDDDEDCVDFDESVDEWDGCAQVEQDQNEELPARSDIDAVPREESSGLATQVCGDNVMQSDAKKEQENSNYETRTIVEDTESDTLRDPSALKNEDLERPTENFSADYARGDISKDNVQTTSLLEDEILFNIAPPKESVMTSANITLQVQTKDENKISISTSLKHSKVHDDDDTAFLTDFLSRAKAQKAARQIELTQTVIQNIPAETLVMSLPDGAPLEQVCEAEHSDNEELTLGSPPILSASVDDEDATLSSPRRSSRAATVRSTAQTNRVKALPSTIHLKRAQGNEFIFNAAKAQAASQVAAQTRANTKRNRGKAINVHSRLEQLKSGKDMVPDLETEGSQPNTEANDGSMEPQKKKRKDKNTKGQKPVKVLKWNEAELTRYREPSPYMWDDDFVRDSPDKQIEDEISETKPNEAQVAFVTSSENEPSTEYKSSDEPARTRIRRVRRGIAGANNGTPASKKTRNMLDEIEDDEMLESTSAKATEPTSMGDTSTTTASQHAVRKSRMPVPVSNTLSKLRQPSASAVSKTAPVNANTKDRQTPKNVESASTTLDLPRRRTLRGRAGN